MGNLSTGGICRTVRQIHSGDGQARKRWLIIACRLVIEGYGILLPRLEFEFDPAPGPRLIWCGPGAVEGFERLAKHVELAARLWRIYIESVRTGRL